MRLEPGHPITDKVRLIRPLGRGAMGEVWLAENTALSAHVAVKILRAGLVESKSALDRFAQEARAAAQIKSPHVVQIFDRGVTNGGDPFIVMELLAGEDLGQHLKRAGAMDPSDVALVLEQASRALQKAHAAGVVHRDIKPANIFLIEGEGRVFIKLVDFGIAKLATREGHALTASDALLGTPYYMSPEQLMSPKYVDHRADVWALAVVAYHCLTGEVPFDGETIGALSLTVAKGYFAPVTALRRGLPASLDGFFERALARDIDARFQSAEAIAAAFRDAVSPTDDSPLARPARMLTPLLPPPKQGIRTLTEGDVTAPPSSTEEAQPLPSTVKAPPPHAVETLKSGDDNAVAGPKAAPAPPRRGARAALGAGLGALLISLLFAAIVAKGTPPRAATPPPPSAPLADAASAARSPSSPPPAPSASAAAAPVDTAPPPIASPSPSPSAVAPAPPKASPQRASSEARALVPPGNADQPLGARCASASQCASGFCADSVCCDTACNSRCEACTGAKKFTGGDTGHCGYISGGEDPDRECGAGKRCSGQGSCVSLTREQIRRLTGHD